ncbi:glyoxalase [Sphingobacteriales bacterium UPWRP_1]|nr:glyoxalase [Sphingobacteriales bacterium TSM_CSS]PSJ78280.1 glyoxalase [Sphingobacteriales bacterium UPWRP_1]
MDKNVVGWFEIPVRNMDRAVKFYETVLGFQLHRQLMGPLEMAWFPWVENAVGSPGSLVYHTQYYTPSENGTLVYFTSPSGNLSVELARVEAAGGKILQPRTQISEEYGYMALLTDTEGNRIALHSRE